MRRALDDAAAACIFTSMTTNAFTATLLFSAALWAQPEVIATGLQGPQKLVLTPQGNFLVTETSMAPNAGRVSFVTRGGARRSLMEGLPSGIGVLGGGTGPTGMALWGRTLFLAIGGGDTERRGAQPGTAMHNPEGASSPIFTSVLRIEFSADVDLIGATFQMTPAQQRSLSDGYSVDLDDGAGTTATVFLLADLPDSSPDPNTIYRFSNPWGLALSENGEILYMSDASTNALVAIDAITGQWRRVVRFPPLPNPTPVGPPVVDAVPTSVRIYGSQVLVSFLTGFPFAPGLARVLAVNPDARTIEPFIFGLTSATDVYWRPRAGDRAQFFVLEFSQNQSAQPPAPGRLLRYDTGEPQVAAAGLITAVSMTFDEATQDMFVLELTGRILRVHID